MELNEVKFRINKTVYYDDGQLNIYGNKPNEYVLTSCILRKNSKGHFYYQAELKYLNCNSVIIVPIEKVKTTKF